VYICASISIRWPDKYDDIYEYMTTIILENKTIILENKREQTK